MNGFKLEMCLVDVIQGRGEIRDNLGGIHCLYTIVANVVILPVFHWFTYSRLPHPFPRLWSVVDVTRWPSEQEYECNIITVKFYSSIVLQICCTWIVGESITATSYVPLDYFFLESSRTQDINLVKREYWFVKYKVDYRLISHGNVWIIRFLSN